ncbi:unnamed protein product, partial [Hapterophycus canaliculatus]
MAWSALDQGWDALQKRMGEEGIVSEPATKVDGALSLNLGGSVINVCRSVLAEGGKDEVSMPHLSNLISTEWDNRLPRDTDDCIVIDESPICMKYLIYKLLERSGTAMGMAGLSFDDELPLDQMAYMPHVSRVLGLPKNMPVVGMVLVPGSTTLEPEEVGPLTATLKEWCPGKPARMELLYRASRDGWTSVAFHSRCGNHSPSTITLFRVSNDDRDAAESVVGGFSSVSWSSYSS